MSGRSVFRVSAAGALALHALLLLWTDGLQGGADMKPHLRLIQQMGESVALRNVYPPAYHALGALVAPLTGLAGFAEGFAWLSIAALIFAFRIFQRAADLPDAAAALFAWAPYGFALTWCPPKIEVAGYALALVALGLQLRGRRVPVALLLGATFAVHTAAALFLGLAGGVLALARRDRMALAPLAAGTALGSPLFFAHLAAGCTAAQALLFSDGDYLRAAPRSTNLEHWDRVLVLANPIALALAAAGVRQLWRAHRPIAVLCAVITALYLNEIWLAPFGARTTLDLVRGLTIFAVPVSIAAGVHLASRPDRLLAATIGSAALALLSTLWVVPETCVSKPIDVAAVRQLSVDRCTFRWRGPPRRSGSARPQAPEVGADGGVERPARLERPAQ